MSQGQWIAIPSAVQSILSLPCEQTRWDFQDARFPSVTAGIRQACTAVDLSNLTLIPCQKLTLLTVKKKNQHMIKKAFDECQRLNHYHLITTS